MTRPLFAGWRGVRTLVAAMAVTIAIPLVSGMGERATWDWSLPVYILILAVLPVLSLMHFVSTVVFLWQLSGRRRVLEAASLVISGAYLATLTVLFWGG